VGGRIDLWTSKSSWGQHPSCFIGIARAITQILFGLMKITRCEHPFEGGVISDERGPPRGVLSDSGIDPTNVESLQHCLADDAAGGESRRFIGNGLQTYRCRGRA
jgi:hypothetical protein